MCLITEQKKPKISKKDKIVYKLLKNGQSSYMPNFNYIIGVLHKTEIKESKSYGLHFDNVVNQLLINKYGDWISNSNLIYYGPGFHSAKNKKRLSHDGIAIGSTIHKFKIPKGSEFYEDVSGLLISNQIVRLT